MAAARRGLKYPDAYLPRLSAHLRRFWRWRAIKSNTMRPELVASSILWAAALGNAILPRQYAAAGAKYALQKGPLDTPWTESVGTNPWPEYPRPRLQRALWKNLNGVWQWQNASAGSVTSPPTGQALQREVLVPSCLESALSGMRFLSVNGECLGKN
jgi:hypothetical protein